MRQWAFMLKHLSKIAAVHPSAAGGTPDEMLGLAGRRIAETLPQVATRAGPPSAKLLHHDPVALDFVQIKLERCGSFRRLCVRRLDLTENFTLVAKQDDAPTALHPPG
jgi:hypothetical protein